MLVSAGAGALISLGTIWMAVAQPAIVNWIDERIIHHVGDVKAEIQDLKKLNLEYQVNFNNRERKDLGKEKFQLQLQLETDPNLKPIDKLKIRERLDGIEEEVANINRLNQNLMERLR